jgi:hypothetical protein
MMRLLGILLLVTGVIVAASAGIRLGETEFHATAEDGRATLEGAVAPAAAAPVDAATRLGDWFDVAGAQFLAGVVILTLGAVLGRVAIGRDGAARAGADGADFPGQLALLGEAIEAARTALGDEPLAATRSRIERALLEVVTPMIDARSALQRRFGLGGCALVIGPLSGAERQLNRVWSVLVDEHVEEAARSLDAAAAELAHARRALAELEAG